MFAGSPLLAPVTTERAQPRAEIDRLTKVSVHDRPSETKQKNTDEGQCERSHHECQLLKTVERGLPLRCRDRLLIRCRFSRETGSHRQSFVNPGQVTQSRLDVSEAFELPSPSPHRTSFSHIGLPCLPYSGLPSPPTSASCTARPGGGRARCRRLCSPPRSRPAGQG